MNLEFPRWACMCSAPCFFIALSALRDIRENWRMARNGHLARRRFGLASTALGPRDVDISVIIEISLDGPMARRRRCDVRFVVDDFRMRRAGVRRGGLRGRSLYPGGLLCHRADIICKSGSDAGAGAFGHARGDRSGGSLCLHGRSIGRSVSSDALMPLAIPAGT